VSEEASLTSRTRNGQTTGRSRRVELPRKELGNLTARPSGLDPVQILEDQGVGRVTDLLPLRAARMAVDSFAFLRGAAAVMAADLALDPSTGLEVQLCGDAHVSNFGIFASPERRLVFDVNDFDETLRGPFEWDVKRLAASLAVSMSQHGADRGVEKEVAEAVKAYRTAMVEVANLGDLEVWYQYLDVENNLPKLREMFPGGPDHTSPADAIVARARRKDSRHAFTKLTGFIDGRLQFVPDPPTVVPLDELLLQSGSDRTSPDVIATVLEGYKKSLPTDRAFLLEGFMAVDMARKVVGVGSVGTRCFLILLLGRSIDDPLILQVKEALPSVLEPHLGVSGFETAGQRVVAGQRLMQTTPDLFLGDVRTAYSQDESHDFYLRQFHDQKASADLSRAGSIEALGAYGQVCAWTLARAHARSGDRAAIAGYLGSGESFDRAIASWAMAYMERNALDHREYLAAIESGRVVTTLETFS